MLVIGALFAEGYKNSLYLYWLIVTGFYLLLLEIYLNDNLKLKQELTESHSKISKLAILKGNEKSVLQISLFPKDIVKENKESEIDLFITSPIPLLETPQIKLLTETEWEIKISNQKQKGQMFANNFEYVLINPLIDSRDKKFFQYKFYVTIDKPGEHELEIQVNDGQVNGQLQSTINVKRS